MKLIDFKFLLIIFTIVVSNFAIATTNQVEESQTDITFVVVGKTGNFGQEHSGTISALNYHFFAEIFVQENGQVKKSSLFTPSNPSEAIPFLDSGYALEMHGGRYLSESELEENYPDGSYIFSYDTPSTGPMEQSIGLVNSSSDSSRLPDAPQITLSQNGGIVSPSLIQPDTSLTVTWSAFNDGKSDPMGIVNDLVFVIMGNCNGERISHSGRPFENAPYLDFSATEFVIPAEHLLPENAYQISVEHAIVDTTITGGVPGLATFATTTFLEVMTLGSATNGSACPEILKNFDAGQTDLRRL
jgi:hypothetical protein